MTEAITVLIGFFVGLGIGGAMLWRRRERMKKSWRARRSGSEPLRFRRGHGLMLAGAALLAANLPLALTGVSPWIQLAVSWTGLGLAVAGYRMRPISSR